MASALSSTRRVLPRLAPALEAAAADPLYLAGDVAATGDVIGPHLPHLRPAVGPLQIPDPALTLVAIDVPLAVAVKTVTDTAVGATAAPHHAATGPAPAHTAAHQTSPQDPETTGHAPDPPATTTETDRQ